MVIPDLRRGILGGLMKLRSVGVIEFRWPARALSILDSLADRFLFEAVEAPLNLLIARIEPLCEHRCRRSRL